MISVEDVRERKFRVLMNCEIYEPEIERLRKTVRWTGQEWNIFIGSQRKHRGYLHIK